MKSHGIKVKKYEINIEEFTGVIQRGGVIQN